MKNLTWQELQEAPTIVAVIYLHAFTNTPVGSSLLDKAIEEHPEYFQDEIKGRKGVTDVK